MTTIIILGVIVLNIVHGGRTTASRVSDINPEFEDSMCWTGSDYLPCKEIKEDILSSKQVQQMMHSNQSCQKDMLDTLRRSLCTKDKHKNLIHGSLICSEDSLISIRDCKCVTYDNDSCSILLGACPYGCGFKPKELTWSGEVYHSLPNNLSEYNHLMCGQFNCESPVCSKCIKHFSPLVYSYELKCVPCTDGHHNNWLKFIIIAFIPLTLSYFLVLLFRVDATSPYIPVWIHYSKSSFGFTHKFTRTLFILKRRLFNGSENNSSPLHSMESWFLPLTSSKYLSWSNYTTNLSTRLCHSHLPTLSCPNHLHSDRAPCQRL